MPPVGCGVGHPITYKNDITLIDEPPGTDRAGTVVPVAYPTGWCQPYWSAPAPGPGVPV